MEALERRELSFGRIGSKDDDRVHVADPGIEVTRDHRPEDVGTDKVGAEGPILSFGESDKEPEDGSGEPPRPGG